MRPRGARVVDLPDKSPADQLTAKEAAEALDVSLRSIRRAIAQGDLPATKLAGSYQIRPSDLDAYRSRLAERDEPRRPVATLRLLQAPALLLPPLPVQFTSFIGRSDLVAALAEALLLPETRLLTLTGPGGVGKTRASIVAGTVAAAAFPDGVGFVPLATVRDPAALVPHLALHLGLREGERLDTLIRLQSLLGDRRCLLVLDNFEQIIAAAPLLLDLLAACPNLTILVTSRMPLRISGERVWPVPPLTRSNGPGAHPGGAEAAQLFLERSQAINPNADLDGSALAAVADLCARLDGLPLAIELAAARANVFSPAAMLSRLDQRLPLLGRGARDQPARLQTMSAAISWSYDLLGPEEQALFRRLSVFLGGFLFEAAEAVALDVDVFNCLATLVDHSLVRATDDPGVPRYTLLENHREFGLAELATEGEDAIAAQAHPRTLSGLRSAARPDCSAQSSMSGALSSC